MISALGETEQNPRAIHDRMTILLGCALGVRSSEIVTVTLGDIEEVPGKGLDITVFSTKTQTTSTIAVAEVGGQMCPVRAVREWIAVLTRLGKADPASTLLRPIRKGGYNVADSALSPENVTSILVRTARLAGVSTDRLTSHAMRATYATNAIAAGFSETAVAMGRWSSVAMVSRYNRSQRWDTPASSWLGA